MLFPVLFETFFVLLMVTPFALAGPPPAVGFYLPGKFKIDVVTYTDDLCNKRQKKNEMVKQKYQLKENECMNTYWHLQEKFHSYIPMPDWNHKDWRNIKGRPAESPEYHNPFCFVRLFSELHCHGIGEDIASYPSVGGKWLRCRNNFFGGRHIIPRSVQARCVSHGPPIMPPVLPGGGNDPQQWDNMTLTEKGDWSSRFMRFNERKNGALEYEMREMPLEVEMALGKQDPEHGWNFPEGLGPVHSWDPEGNSQRPWR